MLFLGKKTNKWKSKREIKETERGIKQTERRIKKTERTIKQNWTKTK